MTHELVVVLAAVSVAYLVKSIAGMGGPLLAIPIIAASTSVEHAVVVVSFANLVTNFYLVWEHRAAWSESRWLLIPLIVSGTVGTIVGSWLLTELDDRILSLVLALLVVAYIIRYLTAPDFELPRKLGRRLAAPVGLAGGLMTGGTGSGGPLYATFLHALRLDRAGFVFTISLLFAIFGPIQMVVLASLGSFTDTRVTQGLLALIPLAVVIPLGVVFSRRLRQRLFEWVVLSLLGFSAIRLLLNALS